MQKSSILAANNFLLAVLHLMSLRFTRCWPSQGETIRTFRSSRGGCIWLLHRTRIAAVISGLKVVVDCGQKKKHISGEIEFGMWLTSMIKGFLLWYFLQKTWTNIAPLKSMEFREVGLLILCGKSLKQFSVWSEIENKNLAFVNKKICARYFKAYFNGLESLWLWALGGVGHFNPKMKFADLKMEVENSFEGE